MGLLKHSVAHESKGKALHIASQKGHLQVVEMLIANDVDVNPTDAMGMKPYDLSAQYPAIQRALLLSGRLDAATKGKALCEALKHSHSVIVELLLQHHANVNFKDGNGQTALDLASNPNVKLVLKAAMFYALEHKKAI